MDGGLSKQTVTGTLVIGATKWKAREDKLKVSFYWLSLIVFSVSPWGKLCEMFQKFS